jgi:hypothetical protein
MEDDGRTNEVREAEAIAMLETETIKWLQQYGMK